MNDVSKESEHNSDPSEEQELRPPELMNYDVVLQHLSWMSNVYGLQIPLTLQVGGLLISGILINRERYNEGMNPLFRNAIGPNASDELKEDFAVLADLVFRTNNESSPDPEKIKLESINYIHLSNATFYYPNGSVPSVGDGFFWRGRLTAIDGFFWGELRIEKKD